MKAIRTHSHTTNQKQDVCLHLPSSVVILYIYHLSVALRAGFLLNKRSQISYTVVSLIWPHNSNMYNNVGNKLIIHKSLLRMSQK